MTIQVPASRDLDASALSVIAEKITEITSFDPSHLSATGHVSAIRGILNLLVELKVFKIASLWKVKQESTTICSRERTSGYFNPDPEDPRFHHEFVFDYSNSCLYQVINDPEFILGKSKVICNLHETKYRSDPFFSAFLTETKTELRTAILLPLKAHRRSSQHTLSYILVVYLDPAEGTARMDDHFLRAITNKISSTLSGQIEVGANEITRSIIDIARGSRTLISPNLEQMLRNISVDILPKYFKYNHALIVWAPGEPDQYECIFTSNIGQSSDPVSASDVKEFVAICGERRGSVEILLNASTHAERCSVFRGARSAIVARISGRGGAEIYGFVALIDKVSPLALRINPQARVVDIFDWEDELLMTHTMSLVAMLAEMTHADVRRQVLAAKYTHEIAFPAFVIVNELDGLVGEAGKLLDTAQRARLSRALSQAKLQLQMTRGVLMTYQDPLAPPTERYSLPPPKKLTSLYELAEECRDLVGPSCVKMNVNRNNISITRKLPQLHVDPGAFRQIFLNLFTNAIKYKGKLCYDKFRLNIAVEWASVSELHVSGTEDETRKYLEDYAISAGGRSGSGWTEGHLVMVEDDGIGIPAGYERKIFDRQIRAPNVQQWNVTGNGLGLAIIQKIVHEHFGAVWVDSRERPTRLAIFLPVILRRSDCTLEPTWTGQQAK